SLDILPERQSPAIIERCPSVSSKTTDILVPSIESRSTTETCDIDDDNDGEIENEILASDDDFDDLPSDFGNDDMFLDESVYENDDIDFIRSAAKSLMTSLAEMQKASETMNKIDQPQSTLYGDDYIVMIKCRRFA
ncbi:unnamed protein product, partial [Rotaria socialis]